MRSNRWIGQQQQGISPVHHQQSSEMNIRNKIVALYHHFLIDWWLILLYSSLVGSRGSTTCIVDRYSFVCPRLQSSRVLATATASWVPSYIAARAALLYSKRERGEALNFFLHTSADQLDAVNQSWPSSNWGGGHHTTRLRDGSVMAISHGRVGVVMVGGKNQNEEIRKQNFSAPGWWNRGYKSCRPKRDRHSHSICRPAAVLISVQSKK